MVRESRLLIEGDAALHIPSFKPPICDVGAEYSNSGLVAIL